MAALRSFRVVFALVACVAGINLSAAGASSGASLDAAGGAADVSGADAVAVRLHPPVELDCSAVRMHVMGNSIDSDVGVRDPSASWPRQMQNGLNESPMLDRLIVINSAVPGSTVVRQNPWDPLGERPAFRLVTHVHTVIASIPIAARSDAIVVIHPSLIDLQDTTVSEAVVVQRSVGGISDVVNAFTAAGVTRVVIVPTLPIGRSSNDLHVLFLGIDMQARIAAQNAALVAAGFLPSGMRSSITDASGFGDPRYYDGFNSLDAPSGPDYMHPDADGHRVIAADVGTDPRLVASLAASCAG